MDKNRKRVVLFVCLIVILIGSVFGGVRLHQRITLQRELESAMEQGRLEQQRLNHLYSMMTGSRFNLEEHGDPMQYGAVIIAFTGLRLIGFSQEEVIEIWVNENHPDTETILAFFDRGGAVTFGNELNRVHRENFEEIEAKFSDLTFGFYDSSHSLPLPVLEHVIALWEAENAQG